MKNFEELKADVKQKWYTTKEKVKTKVHDGYVWCVEHKDETALIITGGIAVLGAVGKAARRIDHKITLQKEQDFKDKHMFDYHLGKYHELKHKLKPREALMIDRRMREGETMIEILTDMNLVK